MKKLYVKLVIFFILGFGLAIQAQNTIPASGGYASGSGGTLSYSLGQLIYTTNTGTNGSETQGVQQPYEISVVTVTNEAIDISLMISVYPNPTSDYLILEVDASTTLSIQSMSYQLFDMQGRLLETKKLEGNQICIVMSDRLPATYFLKLIDGTKEVKTFKIIKNK